MIVVFQAENTIFYSHLLYFFFMKSWKVSVFVKHTFSIGNVKIVIHTKIQLLTLI